MDTIEKFETISFKDQETLTAEPPDYENIEGKVGSVEICDYDSSDDEYYSGKRAKNDGSYDPRLDDQQARKTMARRTL
jgi:hypothetical protein